MRRAPTPNALRNTAVLGLAAVCLHQLIYLISFGTGTRTALDGAGHGYLTLLIPLAAVIAMCAVAGSLAAAARSRLTSSPATGWPACTTLLLGIFGAQEATEVLLRTGSLEPLVTLARQSGPVALAAAIAVGRLVSAALSGLSTLEASLTRTARPRPRAPMALRPPSSHLPLHFPRLGLAFGFARRPPPAATS